MEKKIKIAFDLDGVLVGKPPIVPKDILEWFFRGGTSSTISCRFPKSKINQKIRKLSHFYLFRPPIRTNLKLLEQLANRKNLELYLISSRYSFLEKETKHWLKMRKVNNLFKKIMINKEDLMPHLFKEKAIKQLQPQIFIDDDPEIINYLKGKFNQPTFFLFDKRNAQLLRGLLLEIK